MQDKISRRKRCVIRRHLFLVKTHRTPVDQPTRFPLSEYTLAHGEKLAYDIAHGMDQTLGYLFFPELSACLALYELKKRIIGADTKGLIDLPAMMNALWQRFPEYAISNNIREQLGLNDGFGLLMQSLGYEIELARNQEDLISIFPDHGQNYLIF